MAPTSVPFRNTIKGVACTQTSVPFSNAMKRKRCVYLRKFIVPSSVAALAISLLQCHNGNKTIMRVRKKELGD